MNNYAIIMNVFQEDLEYYVNKLKATEVTTDIENEHNMFGDRISSCCSVYCISVYGTEV